MLICSKGIRILCLSIILLAKTFIYIGDVIVNSVKRYFFLLVIVLLFFVVIMVTYAAFMYSSAGTVSNVVTTGTVTMTYTEGEGAITINNAVPMTEEVGKMLSEKKSGV